MGLFGRKTPALATKLTPMDTPDKFGNSFFYSLFGANALNWSGNRYLQDFLEVPEVNAIISLKVAAFSNGILRVVSRETGKEVTNQEDIVRILRTPNAYQSQTEFIQQTKFYKEVYGNEIQYFLYPVGMPGRVKGWFSISPEIVRIKENQAVPYFMTTENKAVYSYIWNGTQTPFPTDSILHINRANISNIGTSSVAETTVATSQYSNLWGSPILASNQATVRNIRAAYEARNVLIENRGALGILSNGATDGTGTMLPLDKTMKETLQKEYRNYGMTKGQMQIIMTSLNLKWQQMSIDTDKLKLFEECVEDTKLLCLGFGVPYDLISVGVTYDNKLRAERQFYQNTIIPEANEWTDALNRRFEAVGKSRMITMTYDHLPVFQENEKERAQAMAMMAGAIEKLIAQGVMSIPQAQAELAKFGIL